MSWEDCGFKPGKIDGSPLCSMRCGDCDGEHHFYVGFEDDEDEDGNEIERPADYEPAMFFECKHCGVKAEMVADDETEAA